MTASSKPPFAGEARRVRLGDVCEVVSGATPKTSVPGYWGGDINWVTPAELDGETVYVNDTAKHLTNEGFRSASLHMMAPGTVLLTSRAPIGKTAIAGVEMCCNQGFKNLVCSEAIDNEFLLYYLRFNKAALQSMGRGATFSELSKRDVEGIRITLPPLSEQRGAVRRLSAIGKVIINARRQLSLLDGLVKSRFVEMFGDGSNFPMAPLTSCVSTLDSGKSLKCESHPREGDAAGVLKLSAVSSGAYLECENKALPSEDLFVPTKEVAEGDILLARKNTPDLVGRCVLVHSTQGHIMFPDIIFRMRPNEEVDGVYLAYLLNGPLFSKVRGLAHGSARSMSNIPKSELSKLPIPLPPLSLQREFAAFAGRVAKSQVVAQGQIDRLQTLYDSLSQEYFG